jgi:eukaryotic-like serine/threonine-protein kinase
VMELVEGPTLADRLSQGPMPLDETLAVARQIAEALEAAHERGIVHRDLKPANVKLTPDGVVKVLDFGLAKAFDSGTVDVAGASPTITSPAVTRAGVIMGTAAYMSPEQARGRTVDARTDIWAFGCVVFELLTGRSPFDGDTITDVLGAIVHKEPAWTTLPPGTPDRLRRMLHRCLTKDPRQRLHNIADARLEIDDVLAARRSGGGEAEPARTGRPPKGLHPREVTAWSLAALAVTSLIAGAWLVTSGRSGSRAGAEPPPLHVSVVHDEGSEVGVPVISPDGRRVAYSARRGDGTPVIWVRHLDESASRALTGTDGGNRVFWSPDSKQLGFVVGNVLKRIPADGGPVREIARGVRVGASWGAADVVLFGSSGGNIRRVGVSGGPVTDATKLQGPDWEHLWPSLLPDGRHFLFTAKHWAGLAETGAQGIYLGSLEKPADIRQLLPELSGAVYAPPGYVVFARDGQLMAAPFDLDAGRITGEPVALGEAVPSDTSFYTAAVSAAATGTLALRPPPAPAVSTAAGQSGVFDSELAFLTRDGSIASRFGGVQAMTYYMAVSPDGRSVVVQLTDPRTSAADLWRIDINSGARTAVTSMRTSGGYAGSPVWSPDGIELAYGCQPPGILDDVCVQDMRSGAVRRVVESRTLWEHPVAWSRDGQYLLVAYDEYTGASAEELRVWSTKRHTLDPYVKASETQEGAFSPDTRFVAYSSSENGRAEVYVTTFPEPRQTWPLTTDGGRVLSWRADGKEILVATLSGHIAAYPVTTTGGNFSAGSPHILIRNVGFDARYARATADHSRILVRLPKDADKDKGEIRLLFGWSRMLDANTAGGR